MSKTSVLVVGTVYLLLSAMPSLAASAKSPPDGRGDLTAGKKKAKVAVKTCGAFIYRKDGQCVDARAKIAGHLTDANDWEGWAVSRSQR